MTFFSILVLLMVLGTIGVAIYHGIRELENLRFKGESLSARMEAIDVTLAGKYRQLQIVQEQVDALTLKIESLKINEVASQDHLDSVTKVVTDMHLSLQEQGLVNTLEESPESESPEEVETQALLEDDELLAMGNRIADVEDRVSALEESTEIEGEIEGVMANRLEDLEKAVRKLQAKKSKKKTK